MCWFGDRNDKRVATYYENERGEMVTNKLKLVKIHEFTDEETDSHTDKET